LFTSKPMIHFSFDSTIKVAYGIELFKQKLQKILKNHLEPRMTEQVVLKRRQWLPRGGALY